MSALLKPTLGSNADYAARIGLLFDAFNNGNYQFPATQVPSADPNTLDDYEEGDWTPALSFATPGDLSIAYTSRSGEYTKWGREFRLRFNMITSTFTHTSAAGNATISGNPFTPATVTSGHWTGALSFGGITKANYTNFNALLSTADPNIFIHASGSAQARAVLAATDMPTGGAVTLSGNVQARV